MAVPVPSAVIKPDDRNPDLGPSLYVEVTWSGVPLDRPNTGGWLLGLNQRRLAERLVAAVNAGAVYRNPKVLTDDNGRTYVSAEETQFFHKRHLDKSLLAVGY